MTRMFSELIGSNGREKLTMPDDAHVVWVGSRNTIKDGPSLVVCFKAGDREHTLVLDNHDAMQIVAGLTGLKKEKLEELLR